MEKVVPRLAKLAPPRISAAVRRDRLLDRIDALRDCPVVWVAGWPGAGKTTLVADYLQARGGKSLWIQADAEDGDAGTFCHYLSIAALQTLGTEAEGLPPFGAEHSRDVPRFLRRFFRSLYRGCQLTVVIDNFQEIPEGSPVRAALAEAVQEIPPGANLIVISRAMPGPEFARPLAAGAIGTITWEDLRLTLDEAHGIVGDIVPDAEAMASLHAASDGWAAGLVLLRERFHRTGLVNHAVQGDSMELVFGYFAGLLFADESPRVKESLMRLALLPRMTVADAVIMSGDDAAGDLLERLHRLHLFTTRRFQPEITFEFHALLRQFLKTQARSALAPDEYLRACRRAAACLEAAEDGSGAIAIHAEIGDVGAVETAVLRFAPRWLKEGRVRTLADAIARLPEDRVTASAALSYFAGMACVALDQKQARQCLATAFHAFEAAGDFEGQVRAACGVVETYFGNYSEFASIGDWCDRLYKLMRSSPLASLPDDVRLGALAGFLAAGVYGRPEHPGLSAAAIEVRDLLLTADVPDEQRLRIGTWFVTYCSACECIELGRSVVSVLEKLAARRTIGPVRRMWWSIRLGFFRYLEGDLDAAHRCLQAGYALSLEEGIRHADGLIALWGMYVHIASERPDERPPAIPDPRASVQPWRIADMVYVSAAESAALTRRDIDNPNVLRLAQEAVELTDRAQLLWIRVCYRVTLGFTLAHFGRFDEALACVDEMLAMVAGTCLSRYAGEADGVRAYVALRRGCAADAHTELARWVRTMSTEGTMRFRWFRVPHLALLDEAVASGVEAERARHLVQRYWPERAQAESHTLQPPVRVRMLGRFELLKQGMQIDLGRRPPGRLLDVLQLLVLRGRPWATMSELMDTLWPDSEGDRANQALKVAIHRLRRLLGTPNAVEVSGRQLRLAPAWVISDFAEFEAMADECFTEAAQGGHEWVERASTALLGYGGPLLDGSDRPWIVAERARTERKIRRLALAVIDRCIADGQFELAESVAAHLTDRGIAVIDPRGAASFRHSGGADARHLAVPSYRVSEP